MLVFIFVLVGFTDTRCNTADEISALSPAESFKDARILKLLGCGALGGRKHSEPRRVRIC